MAMVEVRVAKIVLALLNAMVFSSLYILRSVNSQAIGSKYDFATKFTHDGLDSECLYSESQYIWLHKG